MSIELPNWDPSRPGHTLLDMLRSEVRTRGDPSPERIREIAEMQGTTAAKVRGVIGYYSELKASDETVRVCQGEACRSRGSRQVAQSLRDAGETVGTLHCAGLCATGPAVLRDEDAIPISAEGEGIQVFLSLDSMSLSAGVEQIAHSIPKDVTLTRTGSRGLFHLEPMLELEIDGIRHAFGPVKSEDVEPILHQLTQHETHLGTVDELLAPQKRFAMDRMGEIDPLTLTEYEGLSTAQSMGPEGILSQIEESGLRGRGGAGFPTHFKWRSAMQQDCSTKHVVANADEGDAGTFIDRMIMEGDPHALIEGMLICAHTIGATQGWVYLRSEYPQARRILQKAIDDARGAGILGGHFDITIAIGAGSYVCGEETALLESLEGRRGEVRARPPYPTEKGLYDQPTIINNVLTFALASAIMRHGPEAGQTIVAQLVGATEQPTCVEVPFGRTIGELFDEFSSLQGVTAIQVGGPLGAVFTADEIRDVELSFEGLTEAGGLIGHGGFVCYGEDFNPRQEAIEWMRFFRDESCGKCTPCRIGTQRALELIQRIGTEDERAVDRVLLDELDDVMTSTSLCALGGLAMNPVRSTMQRWPASFGGVSE